MFQHSVIKYELIQGFETIRSSFSNSCKIKFFLQASRKEKTTKIQDVFRMRFVQFSENRFFAHVRQYRLFDLFNSILTKTADNPI